MTKRKKQSVLFEIRVIYPVEKTEQIASSYSVAMSRTYCGSDDEFWLVRDGATVGDAIVLATQRSKLVTSDSVAYIRTHGTLTRVDAEDVLCHGDCFIIDPRIDI